MARSPRWRAPDESMCRAQRRSAAQPPQPSRGCGVLLVRRAVPDDRFGEVGPWVTAEKDHVAANSMQPHHCLGHPGIVDVTFGIDTEAVVTKTLFGWARLDPAEVHAAARKLFQDLQQSAWMVVAHEQDHGGFVGTGGWADGPGPRDQDKSRDGVRVVRNVFGERHESVEFAGDLCTNRCVEP